LWCKRESDQGESDYAVPVLVEAASSFGEKRGTESVEGERKKKRRRHKKRGVKNNWGKTFGRATHLLTVTLVSDKTILMDQREEN